LDEEMEEIAARVDTAGTSFTVRLKDEQPADFRLSLVGEFQAENAALAESIVEHGALVSEYPLGAKPRAENFPRRNRIMSVM
ncbi:MAG: DNA-processing protein DprA, partial [Dehalococcoidia bacterium]